MSDNVISLYPEQQDDNRPLPERIASFFNFRLQHDDDDIRRYNVFQWIAGVLGIPDAKRFWKDLIRRYPYIEAHCKFVKTFPTQTRHKGIPHADAEMLYEILVRLPSKVGFRDEIIDELVKAGVKLDDLIHNPEKAEQLFANLTDRNEYNKIISEGRTHEYAVQWVESRRREKNEQNMIHDVWHHGGASGNDYARLNNDISKVAVGETATVQKKKLRITGTPRNYHSPADNVKISFTCMTARNLHLHRNSEGVDEFSKDIHDVQPVMNVASPEIDKLFSQEPRRLPKGKLPGSA